MQQVKFKHQLLKFAWLPNINSAGSCVKQSAANLSVDVILETSKLLDFVLEPS